MTELVLVSHVLCPYVQRVAITLHLSLIHISEPTRPY